jgi:hypothetical protein
MNIRWFGILSILGGLTAVLWQIAVNQGGFGYPGSATYTFYELVNRLMFIPLLLMVSGWVGIYLVLRPLPARFVMVGSTLAMLGFVLMLIGNLTEFWLFTDLPYGAWNLRSFAWMTFLFGMLATLIGSILLGVVIWQKQGSGRWSGILLIILLPLAITLLFSGGGVLSTLALGAFGLGIFLLSSPETAVAVV